MTFSNAAVVILVLPLVISAVLAALPSYRLSAALNVVSAFVTFAASVLLFAAEPEPNAYVLVDDLNVVFIVLNTFVGFTASVFSATYIAHEIETGRLTALHLRFYHAMYQFLLFSMNLALIANNIGLLWVAIEFATLTTVLMVGIYRTQAAIEAAWKYFILGSVGIALALFGTILVYMAARPVLGEGVQGMLWTSLIGQAPAFDPALLNLAFVFLLLGYGTKVGLAPLHAWLPDAHAEGPTPISAVLSGLLLNVALYAVLRFKLLLDANERALAPGPLMATLGLVSIVFAAFMLYRRRDVKRMFAYSSIEHMGVIVFAFGVGGPLANFAALLHMAMHSLTKSAIFYTVGQIAQVKGTQKIADIRGLTVTHPMLGWSLVFGVFAIVGLPPMGVFMSEFLIVSSTFERAPWVALPLVFGLLVALGALVLRLQGMAFGAPTGSTAPAKASCAAYSRAFRARADGRRLPPAPAGGMVPPRRADAPMSADPVTASEARWREAAESVSLGQTTLVSLWGDEGRMRLALREANGTLSVVEVACDDGAFPSVAALHPPASRLERSACDLFGFMARDARDDRPWLDHGRWACRHPLGDNVPHDGAADPYPFLKAEGPGLHQIPVGPVHAGIIEPGHFRFHAGGETVVRLEERLGYKHKGVDALMRGATIERVRSLAARVSGDSTVAYGVAFARAVEAAIGVDVPVRAHWLRGLMAELERLANHLGDIGAICNDAAFALMLAHCGMLRERTLRAAKTAFGHRLMMDAVAPGGVAADLSADGAEAIAVLVREVRTTFPKLVSLYDNTASLQDRTVGTGILTAELARAFGAGGYVGRGSGRSYDARRDNPYPPYDSLSFRVPTRRAGDVNARIWVRIDEISESLGLIESILADLPDGPFRVALPRAEAHAKAWRWSRGSAATSSRMSVSRRTERSRAATCATRPGSSGRSSRLRSRATSSRTFRFSTSRSIAPIPGAISKDAQDAAPGPPPARHRERSGGGRP